MQLWIQGAITINNRAIDDLYQVSMNQVSIKKQPLVKYGMKKSLKVNVYHAILLIANNIFRKMNNIMGLIGMVQFQMKLI